jgi:hypothetical protein
LVRNMSGFWHLSTQISLSRNHVRFFCSSVYIFFCAPAISLLKYLKSHSKSSSCIACLVFGLQNFKMATTRGMASILFLCAYISSRSAQISQLSSHLKHPREPKKHWMPGFWAPSAQTVSAIRHVCSLCSRVYISSGAASYLSA